MSWNFLCADMFPCEDSKTLSVCPYPEKRNHLSFVNISPTLVIDASMERSSVLEPKVWFSMKNTCLPECFCCHVLQQFLAYAVHIDWCYHSIHKHSSGSQHVSLLTTCTFVFRQVCTIEPSLFDATSGMHRRPFEGRHLVTWWRVLHITNITWVIFVIEVELLSEW